MTNVPGYLTLTEIAEAFGVHYNTAVAWRAAGLFPGAILVGKAWLVPESDLLTFNRPRRGRRSGAKLAGANLSGANLSGANLSEASWDEDTTWPEGFNPGVA